MSKISSDEINIATQTYKNTHIMDEISIRYGEAVTLPIDAGDATAVSADIYIGRPGEMYILTQNITLTAGVGEFEFTPDDTKIPLGTYYYQINITDDSGYPEKYPSPEDGCSSEETFPKFIVSEALDEQEVS